MDYFMLNKCVSVHYHLPYNWQILDKDGKTWKNFQNGEEIEKAFCNPANDVSPGPQSVNFISMTCGRTPVRRLSKTSSVTKPPNFILMTEWLWYWKNNQGEWTEYGQGMDAKHAVRHTSQKLEEVYQADPHSEISVCSEEHTYIVFLKDMCQQNTLFKTKREIRRRPRFISALEVEDKLKCENSSSSSVVVPAHWDKGALPEISYKLVPLSKTDAEFIKVQKLFKKTMSEYTITNIQRNQNSFLWSMFQRQKEQMKKRNRGREVDERLLFHGTAQSRIDAICEENFDWRVCGDVTVYGKGSYFARDASYSHNYAQCVDKSKKLMFVARVLVGLYTTGQSRLVRPPAKTTDKSSYDSCVDSESDPSIFVIFEKYQIYPEFVIEYGPEESRPIVAIDSPEQSRCLIL